MINEVATVAEQKSLTYVLKRETLPSHQKVERYLSKILFDKHLCRRKYCQVLVAMQSAYLLMESAAKQHKLAREFMLERSKLDWLETDINALNVDPEYPVLKNSCPITQSEAETMGALYVMEGATLGGSYIVNKLKRHDWLSEERGLRFFYNYGSERSLKWRNFQTTIIKYDSDIPIARQLIISGANKAFELVDSSLRDATYND